MVSRQKFIGLVIILTLSVVVFDISIDLLRSPQGLTAQSGGEEGVDSFKAHGNINSVIYTVNGNWDAKGKWNLDVSDGKLTYFQTTMNWKNGTSGHTHEFQNFESDNNIELDSNKSVSIEGGMDVGTNGAISWPSVPAEITIEKGKIITISVDDEDTNNHFGNQAVHGTVTSLQQCSSSTPGPEMAVPAINCKPIESTAVSGTGSQEQLKIPSSSSTEEQQQSASQQLQQPQQQLEQEQGPQQQQNTLQQSQSQTPTPNSQSDNFNFFSSFFSTNQSTQGTEQNSNTSEPQSGLFSSNISNSKSQKADVTSGVRVSPLNTTNTVLGECLYGSKPQEECDRLSEEELMQQVPN